MSLEHPSRETTPEQCATELMEVIPPVMQFIRTEMRGQSASLLSVPQFRVLAYLHIHPGASLSDVADHLGVTRATASAMTERLVQRNLVDRTTDSQQRRRIVLKLTVSGATYLGQIREITRNKIAVLLDTLTEDQLSSVFDGLSALGQVFKAAVSKLDPPSEPD